MSRPARMVEAVFQQPVSGPCSRAFDTIIRRIDLGPLK